MAYLLTIYAYITITVFVQKLIIMGDHKYDMSVCCKFPEQFSHLAHVAVVKAAGWLIKYKESLSAHDRLTHRKPLPLTA